MNASGAYPAPASLRRGACPGLAAPMATGDGLLARFTPSGSTLALDAFAGLCAAARTHGNGIIEITSRGSIQIRGLNEPSAPLFAAEVAALDIEATDGIPVLTDPLGSGTFAAQLRTALAGTNLAAQLSEKVSVVIDLDGLAADIVLRTVDRARLHVAIGGDCATAIPLGAVPMDRAADSVIRLFVVLAAAAPRSRMREAIARNAVPALRAAIADVLVDGPAPARRPPFDPIGIHRHPSGGVLGLGLPFGHSDSEKLLDLIAAARQAGASGVRTSPGRALLLMGLPAGTTAAVCAQAAALGFIVDPGDQRRKVVACAGAPICASGEIAARALAPALADAARALPAGEILHVSGCAKGCAHPSPAPLAVFGRDGRCDVFVDGVPTGSVTAAALPGTIARLVRSRGNAP